MMIILQGLIHGMSVWLEEPKTFPWREAVQVKLTIGPSRVFLFSEFVPLPAWDDELGTDETSHLRLSDEDQSLRLHEEGVDQPCNGGEVRRQHVYMQDERLVGLELFSDEGLLWGFYSNQGSFFLNFSDDPEICATIKASLGITGGTSICGPT